MKRLRSLEEGTWKRVGRRGRLVAGEVRWVRGKRSQYEIGMSGDK
jgi:hypothetical protein